jgi:hypothetical protein
MHTAGHGGTATLNIQSSPRTRNIAVARNCRHRGAQSDPLSSEMQRLPPTLASAIAPGATPARHPQNAPRCGDSATARLPRLRRRLAPVGPLKGPPFWTRPVISNRKRPNEVSFSTQVLAVSYLDSDCGHTDWFKTGSVIFRLTEGGEEGLDLFDSWSSRSTGKYKGRRSIERQWGYYANYKGHHQGIATLRRLLQERGESLDAICRQARLQEGV